jgi:hypothetical protein
MIEKYSKPVKQGIYVEVNCSNERPVKNVPPQFLKVKEETKHEIILHQQLIEDNLFSMFRSKYFVKIGGRKTRGNGVIEAISLGTLVLMNPSDIIHKEILTKETWCRDADEVIATIKRLDSDNEEYERLHRSQRELVSKYMFDCPWESLKNSLNYKRSKQKILA